VAVIVSGRIRRLRDKILKQLPETLQDADRKKVMAGLRLLLLGRHVQVYQCFAELWDGVDQQLDGRQKMWRQICGRGRYGGVVVIVVIQTWQRQASEMDFRRRRRHDEIVLIWIVAFLRRGFVWIETLAYDAF
jgi:hypothetical protein